MRKIFLLQGLLCFLVLKNVAQPSIPVDPVTGSAQISIPLGDITYGNLTVPIGLSYNTTGVKPQSSEGLPGMNWEIVGGGKVIREVRGLPDDYTTTDPADSRRGWLINYAQQINDFSFTGDDNLLVCTDEVNDWSFIHDLTNVRDSEPDLYTFFAPGLSGRFVFGADKLPKLIPYQDVKIDFNPAALNGKISSITVTKNDGTVYTFTVTEVTTREATPVNYSIPRTQFLTELERFKEPLTFNSVWSLSAIKSSSGASIEFCYGNQCREDGDNLPRERVEASKRTIELSSTTSTASSPSNKQYTVQDVTTVKDMVKITSAAKSVHFYGSWGVLREVRFSANGSNAVKKYKLIYMNVKNASDLESKRFLKAISEEDGACGLFPSFQFEYYDVTDLGNGSATTSMVFHDPAVKQDYWGYFNDLAVSKNPTIYYFNGKTGAERYRFYPIPGTTPTLTINGADRNVNPAAIISGSLKKITYPSGSTATITLEPNDYHDAEANLSQYGPGLRVKQVSIKENVIAGSEDILYDYEYKLANSNSSGKWIYRSVFGYHDVGNFYATLDDQSSEPIIMYERVKVKRTGRGETIYEYLLPGMYPITTVSDWTASQTKFARGYSTTGCASYGELKKEYFSHPFAVNSNYDFERGLIWKITDYDASVPAQKVQEIEYNYQRLGTPTVLVKGLKFELLNGTSNLTTGANANSNMYVFSKYSLLTNLGKVVLTETVRTPDMTDNTKQLETSTTYSYSTVHRMLSTIEVVNSDGDIRRTKMKYAKDFANLTQPVTTDVNSVSLKKLNDNFMHAAPVEVISSVVKSGVETITGAKLNLYAEFPDSLRVIRILTNKITTFNNISGFVAATVTPASGSNQVFSVDTSKYKSTSFVDKYDFAGNAVSTRDIQRIRESVHLGYKKTLPIATFQNAASEQVVFEGFETYTGGGFDIVSAGLSYPAGWTGNKAVQLQTTKLLERSSIVKGVGSYYRYSCWLKAAASCQVTFKVLNGTTLVSTGTISYASGDINTWKYFEGRVSVASANSTFKLRVESTGTIDIDDIAFYPETSTIFLNTYDPLIGKTSETDTRGVSTFYEYDGLGRAKFVKDQDKNLRQTVDYYYKTQPAPVLSADISASHAVYQVVKDVTVTYTAPTGANCGLAPITYDWYVNDVKLGNNVTTFSYAYSSVQKYVVKLVVTHPTYGTNSSSITYDVKFIRTGPLVATVNDASGTNSYAYCDANHQKTFNLVLDGCYVLPDVNIKWYFNSGGGWLEYTGQTIDVGILSSDGLTFTFDPIIGFNGISNLASYSIRCDVSTTCPVTGITSSSSFTRGISYNGNTQCL